MKEKKGISLIVLIVTIIVMIIIAGAVIISLTETNIIVQAENATQKHNAAELKSAASLAYTNWLLEEKSLNNEKTLQVQNYIRESLISQNLIKAEEFSKYYVTPTGTIEEVDEEYLIIIIDVPEDNIIENFDFQFDGAVYVDWGDETIEEEAVVLFHEYKKKGTYEVKIKGNVFMADFRSSGHIKAIKSWGKLNFEYLFITDAVILDFIAMPNAESFKNLTTISFTNFYSLEVLPDYMFKNCKKLSNVSITGCTSLREIPPHLFEGCDALTDVDIADCPLIKDIPEEWQ